MSFWSALKEVTRARGRANEARALDAAKKSSHRWVRSVRAGTQAEDREGIDIIVSSDVGELFIQVKSSVAGRDRFLEKNRKKHIEVVVANCTDDELKKRIDAAINRAREHVIAKRKR